MKFEKIDLLNTINHYLNISLNFIDNLTSKKNWILTLAFVSTFYVLIISFPSYLDLKHENIAVQFKIDHPFNPLPESISKDPHYEKCEYRIFVPLIANIFGFEQKGCFILQNIFGLLNIFLVTLLTLKITNNKRVAFLTTISFVSIYAGKIGYYDVFSHFDSIAIGLLLIAFYFNSPLIIFSAIVAASFVDERALIASSLLFNFYLGNSLIIKKNHLQIGAVLLAWISVFILRFILQYYLNFKIGTQDIGIAIFLGNYKYLPLAIIFSLEGLWLWTFAFLLIFKQSNIYHKINIMLLWANVCIVLFVSLLVQDVSRSTAYLLPVLFVSLIYVKEYFENKPIEIIAFISTLICIALPTLEFFDQVYWTSPIIPKIFKFF